MQTRIYHLITGSNLGNREEQLMLVQTLIQETVGPILRKSRIYETQPWGYDDQPWFLNQVLEVLSEKTPETLILKIKDLEIRAGRQPHEKWHARHMDIDILLVGDTVLKTANLEIPHPLLQDRLFVLVPLLDLVPDFLHPVFGKTIEELYLDCRDTGEVYIFSADE